MAIDIRGLGNQAALAQIARLAYGSGSSEGISGGKGNIGILDGRVVKFNTHWRERGGKPSAEMRTSCNELRTKLSEIATAMLAAAPNASPRTRERFEKTLASVRRELGMNADGNQVETQNLLDRKTVAKVMNAIRDTTGFDVWQELRNGDTKSLSSEGVVTKFGNVQYGVYISDLVQHHVQGAVDAIAHPADGRPGVVLDDRAKAFLMELIERDLRDPEQREVTNMADVARDIRNFTSPYLIVTLQTFNLSSAVLSRTYMSVGRAEQMAASLIGSPRGQRTDRADVALTFLKNNADLAYTSFAMALVAEKMPKMRQIQPNGRLTAATVWKACFGESIPKSAGVLNSKSFVDAFLARLDRLTVDLTAKHGTGAIKGVGLTIDRMLVKYPLVGSGLFNGASFTSVIRRSVGDPKFVPDAARDYVSARPLYTAEDALVKTEQDLENLLVSDFKRNFPVITMSAGMAEGTADFRSLEGQGLSDDAFRPNVRTFVSQVDRVFGNQITPVQRNLLLIGLSQVGLVPFTALVGIGGEHSQAHIDIHREDDGAITLTYSSLPDSPVEAHYSYRIEPDGKNFRVGDFVSRIRPQAADNARLDQVEHYRNVPDAVQSALDVIANPTDGKPGVVLTDEAKAFLMEMVERDIHDPNRHVTTDLAEVARGIRDFTSPYLVITLQAFHLNAELLTSVRPSLCVGAQTTTFLAGSPRDQRADRADVALALLADASRDNSGPDSGFALALVSEKMPEMRRLQPEGRLTGETVWKACFDENLPEGMAGGFGSRAFSDAFFKRLFRLGDDLLAQCGGLRDYPNMTFTEMSGLFLPVVFSGICFSASIRVRAKDPTFKLNAAQDFVAAPPLYPIEDALVKTDNAIRNQIMADFYRDNPIVSLHDGQDVETFDFAAVFAAVHQNEEQPAQDQPAQPPPRTKFAEKVNEFVAAFDARYGDRMTEAQRKVLLLGLTQAALVPFSTIEQVKDLAHTKMTFDIRREDDGAFVITYATDPDRKDIDIRYSYRVEPDGTNSCVGEFTYDVSFEEAS